MSMADAFESLPCVKCGTPRYKGCGCWIRLKCPKCGKEKGAELDKTDPPGTALVVTQCPECVGGDFGTVDYFNKQGQQIDLEGKPMAALDSRAAPKDQ